MRSILPVIAWAVALGVVFPGVQGLGLSLADPKAPPTIVGFAPGTGGLVEDAVELLGGTVTQRSDALSILVATGLTGTTLATLSLNRLVLYTEADGTTRLAGAQWNGAQWNGAQWNGAQWNGAQWNGASDPGLSTQWGLDAIEWTASPEGDARLCVLDSGVDHDHPDLAENVADDAINLLDGTDDADDDAGHGTHVAGIAAAVRGNGVGGAGVADGKILRAKVLDANGRGSVGDLALGMAWCADHGADVALLALSVDGSPRTIQRAIDYLDARNVVVVASAGNKGSCSDCVTSPARDPRVLAVAAVGRDGRSAAFSSAGPEVDLAAPGVNITSTFDNGGYASGSGTSQAAAFVAGAALALRETHPGMAASDVRARLVATARDLGPAGRDDATGAGLLDLGAALGGA